LPIVFRDPAEFDESPLVRVRRRCSKPRVRIHSPEIFQRPEKFTGVSESVCQGRPVKAQHPHQPAFARPHRPRNRPATCKNRPGPCSCAATGVPRRGLASAPAPRARQSMRSCSAAGCIHFKIQYKFALRLRLHSVKMQSVRSCKSKNAPCRIPYTNSREPARQPLCSERVIGETVPLQDTCLKIFRHRLHSQRPSTRLAGEIDPR